MSDLPLIEVHVLADGRQVTRRVPCKRCGRPATLRTPKGVAYCTHHLPQDCKHCGRPSPPGDTYCTECVPP